MSNMMQQIKNHADCLVSAEKLNEIIHTMAKIITEKLKNKNPLVLIAMKGGVIFGGHLLTLLDFPLEVDYLHATRYHNQLLGSAHLIWKAKPDVEVTGRHVLVVDDIWDEGATLAEILKALQAQGAARIYTAVLVNKKHQRKVVSAWQPDFIGVEVADRYLFGFGMDYKGYWRNANGIYAVAEHS